MYALRQLSSITYRLALGVGIWGLLAMPALAGTIHVDSVTDAPAGASALAAGTCADASGACTLRAAVQVADAAPAPSTIILPAGTYNLSIVGVDEAPSSTTSVRATVVHTPDPSIGDLNITQSMAIVGAGASQTIVQWDPAIAQSNRDRVFHVEASTSNISVSITGVSIKNGYTPPPVVLTTLGPTEVVEFLRLGGGIASGSAASVETVNPQATHGQGSGGSGSEGHSGGSGEGESGFAVDQLSLSGVHVIDNQAGSDGGGIFSAAPLMLVDSIVSGNRAGTNGGGIYSDGALTVSKSTIGTTAGFSLGNEAENGGGIFDTGFHISDIESSAIVGNTATGGGAIAGRRLVLQNITNTTIADNFAQDVGGGITTNGRVVLTNVTISGNQVLSDTEGGGAGLNSFGPSGGGSTGGGANSATYTLVNTILSGNVIQGAATAVANCGTSGGTIANHYYSLGHNLENGNSCALDGPGDLTDTDPLLKPLAANGGFTETMALSSRLNSPADAQTSPAVDAGDNASCPNNDQRGELRPADGDLNGTFVCDIGAYELFIPSADLHINNMSAPNSVYVGDRFDITVEVHVDPAATAPAQGVRFTSGVLPSGLKLNGATLTISSGTSSPCSVSSGVVTCNAGNLASGQTATVDMNVTGTAPGSVLTVSASVSQTAPIDPDLTNNSAKVRISVVGRSDLGVQAHGPASPVTLGTDTDVTFTIANAGPHGAGPVSFGIALPAGLAYVSVSLDGGTCNAADPTAILCRVPSIAAASSASGTLTVTGQSTGVSSVVLDAYAPQLDDNPVNDSVTVPITVEQVSDLSVATSAATTPVAIGVNTDIPFTVANGGPNSAGPVTITIKPSQNLTYQAVSVPGGSCNTANPAAIDCTVTSLASGASANGVLTVSGATDGPASVSFAVQAPQTDYTAANNVTTATLTVAPMSDLSVSVSTSGQPVLVGKSTDVSFTVSNAGPNQAGPVTVTIKPSRELGYQAVTISSGSCDSSDPSAISCTIAALASGASDSGTLTVTGVAEGTASVDISAQATQLDPDATNNSATAAVTIEGSSDLGVTADFSPQTMGPDGEATLTLTVTNQGPSAAPNVKVVTVLPSGLAFKSSASGSCSSGGDSVTCTDVSLGSGQSMTAAFTVTATVNSGDLQATSTASSDNADLVPANNSVTSTLSIVPGGGGGATGGFTLLAFVLLIGLAAAYRRSIGSHRDRGDSKRIN